MHHRFRCGYSLVELLMVVTTICAMITMLIPAVQAAREASRRHNCGRHASQLMLAIQQYESAFQCYPPGTIDNARPIRSQPAGYHHNWITQILPYIEQMNAYRAIDRRVGVYHANNSAVRQLTIPVLRCPSSLVALPRSWGYSNYAGVHHDREAPIDVSNNGVFFLNSRIRYEDVIDGLSNTIFVGEKLLQPNDLGWMSGTRATLRNPGSFLAPQTGPPPNPLLAVGGFGSNHPGGLHFGFGDGSVPFRSNGISPKLMAQLTHRADMQLNE